MNPARSDNTKKAAAPFTNYQFDFGLGTASGARSRGSGFSLKDQKANPIPSASARTPSFTSPPSTAPAWGFPAASGSTGNVPKTWAPAGGGGVQSMVGDITGKSWAKVEIGGSKAGSGIGVVRGVGASKADMFGDLLGGTPFARSSAVGSLKTSSSAQKPSFSMAGVGASLPKGGPSLKESMRSNSAPAPSSGNVEPPLSSSGSAAAGLSDVDEFGDFFGHAAKTSTSFAFPSSLQSSQAQPIKADPFESLTGQGGGFADTFNSLPISGQGLKRPTGAAAGDDFFGVNFTPDVPRSSSKPANPPYSTHSPDLLSDMFGGGSSASSDPIGSIFGTQKPSVVKKSQDPLEALWTRSASAAPPPPQAQPVPAEDDWNIDGFGGGVEEGITTELEQLPPPPAGVNVQIAQNKGSEFYKQGQFPDAIKWLSWAVVLCENNKSGSNLGEILGCRASCYKEVGEYKKAVEDCCKVLELKPSDTEVLMQRAFLYENMEKYKLGVADLREVLKKDPSNRLASNTLSRLIKMVENS